MDVSVRRCKCTETKEKICRKKERQDRCEGVSKVAKICQPLKRAGWSGDMTQLQGRQSSRER